MKQKRKLTKGEIAALIILGVLIVAVAGVGVWLVTRNTEEANKAGKSDTVSVTEYSKEMLIVGDWVPVKEEKVVDGLTITADGKLTLKGGGTSVEATYKVDGDSLKMTYAEKEETLSFKDDVKTAELAKGKSPISANEKQWYVDNHYLVLFGYVFTKENDTTAPTETATSSETKADTKSSKSTKSSENPKTSDSTSSKPSTVSQSSDKPEKTDTKSSGGSTPSEKKETRKEATDYTGGKVPVVEPETQQETHSSEKALEINGQKVYVGDTITVTLNLKTPVVLVNYQGYTSYDSKLLEFVSAKSNSGGLVNNKNSAIYYNSSILSGIDFTEGGTVYTATFKVKKSGYTTIINKLEIASDLDLKDVGIANCTSTIKIFD